MGSKIFDDITETLELKTGTNRKEAQKCPYLRDVIYGRPLVQIKSVTSKFAIARTTAHSRIN